MIITEEIIHHIFDMAEENYDTLSKEDKELFTLYSANAHIIGEPAAGIILVILVHLQKQINELKEQLKNES
jgi:hypothetical protein